MSKQKEHSSEKDKLITTEQQLKATIQQLRASEQQLKAANQQLQAEVTERKKAEEEKDRLVKAIEIAAEAINITDSDVRMIYTNKAMDRLFRYKKGELIGKHISILNAGPPQKAREVPRVIIDAINKKGVWTGEVRNQRKDGTEFTSLANVTGLIDERGKITNYISVQQDITERKQAEEALRAANQQLQASEQQLKAANQQLRASEQQLKAANQQLQAEVTERKRAEEALRDSEALYSSLVENLPQNIFRKDLEGRHIFANENYCKTLKRTPDEIIGKMNYDLFPAELAEKYCRDDQMVIETGEIFDTVEKHELPDGKRIYVQVVKTPLQDSTGKIIGTQGIFWDVTERKRAEEALRAANQQLQAGEQQLKAANQQLRASEQQLKAANQQLQASEQQLKASNQQLQASEQQLRAANQQLEATNQQLRASQEEIQALAKFPTENPNPVLRISSDGIILYANEASAPVLETWECKKGQRLPDNCYKRVEKVVNSGEISGFEFACRNDRIFLVTLAPIVDAGYVNAYGLDITKRKQAEKALRESQELFSAFMDQLPATAFMKDENSRVQYVNPYMADEFGSDKWIGQTAGEYFPSEIAEGVLAHDKKALTEGASSREEWVPDKNGEMRCMHTYKFPIMLEGKPQMIGGVSFNITERKRAEEKLLDYQAQLRSLASQLTLAEEHERHQIATELHASIGQSLVISKITLDELRSSAVSGELATTLGEVCKSLDQTIQETKSLTFDLSSPLLYELGFETAVSEWLSEEIGRKHGIATELEEDKQPKPLNDDVRVLLFRDVRELLINVVKHANAKKVKVSIYKVGSDIHVTVEDNGWGFDPVEIRATAVRKGGFGLFSIRERLEQLGGHLEIESATGKGTKATLIAPLRREKIDMGVEK